MVSTIVNEVGGRSGDGSNAFAENCSNLIKSKNCSNLTNSKNLTQFNYIINRLNFLTPNNRAAFI